MKHLTLSTALLYAVIVTACSSANVRVQTAPTAPHSWMDAPLAGVVRPPNPCAVPGGLCEVTSHSSDPMHIVQVEFSVNGQVVQISPNTTTEQTLVLTKQQWSPPGPGNYSLRVRAQNSTGVWGEYAQAVVTIEGAATQPPPPPPFVVPSATSASKPGATTPSPFPAASIAFYADAATVAPGQCTTIHWQVTNVSQVALDNATVSPSGSKQDCPSQTITHTLRVVTLDGQTVVRTLALSVTASSRTSTRTPTRTLPPPPPPVGCNGAPVISSFGASPSSILLGASSTLSWGAVTNADSVEIDNGIGGVAAPGSKTVSPGLTTVYILTAHCKEVATTARTIVTVVQPPTSTPILRQLPTRTPTRTPIIPH